MANIDDKDKKIPEVPHLEQVTGDEKIPVSANGEPRYVEVKQIVGMAGLPDVQATPASREIIYVTNDSKAIKPNITDYIESNEYYPALGYGVLKLDRTVQSLGNYFAKNKNVVKVICNSSIVSFSYGCFSNCTSLEEIDGISIMGATLGSSFNSCSSLRKIGTIDKISNAVAASTFGSCVLLDYDIEINIATTSSYIIGQGAFASCYNIRNLTLGENVNKNIDQYAFENCKSLEKIIVKSNIGFELRSFLNTTPKYIDTVQNSVANFPSPDKLETLILRYDGVVPDLADYASTFISDGVGRRRIEIPVMPVPQSEGEDVPTTLDLPVPMAAYIGTPNTWLKIYVPENRLKEYQEAYPTLIYNLHPITGEDIYALKEDVQPKLKGLYVSDVSNSGGSINVKQKSYYDGVETEKSIDFKTLNGQSLFGQGDIKISGGGSIPADYEEYKLMVDEHDRAIGVIELQIGNLSFKAVSQSDYDTLDPKSPNTLYIITK